MSAVIMTVANASYTLNAVSNHPLSDSDVLLLPADGYSKAEVYALQTGEPKGIQVNINYNGNTYGPYVTKQNGYSDTPVMVGPSNIECEQTVEVYSVAEPGVTDSLTVKYVKSPKMTLILDPASPSRIKAGEDITITVKLEKEGGPIQGANVSLVIMHTNGTVVTKYLITDSSGIASTIEKSSSSMSTGGNTVILAQVPSLGLMKSGMIAGQHSTPARIDLIQYYPGQSVVADGMHTHIILARFVDEGGNPIANEPINISGHDTGKSYEQVTNENGVIKFRTMPSVYTGRVNYTIKSVNYPAVKNTSDIYVEYINGQPKYLEVYASPNRIASSDITNSKIKYNIHESQITVKVMDEYFHPLPGQHVSLNTTHGQLLSPLGGSMGDVNGYTNDEGEFITTFTLDDKSKGNGTILMNASCFNITPNLYGNTTLEYVDYSHLNITTSVSPRVVRINETVNVSLVVDGVGWAVGRKPVDMMFVIDRSGSMGDPWYGWFGPTEYQKVVANEMAPDKQYHLVETFNHNETRMIVRLEPKYNESVILDAKYLDDTIPTVVLPDHTYVATVRMKNTGNVVWTKNSLFTLDSTNSDTKKFNSSLKYQMNEESVYPNQVATFYITMNTTEKMGTFYPEYRMKWAEYPFGENIRETIRVSLPNGECVAEDIPDAMIPNLSYKVTVTMKNTGIVPWTSDYLIGLKASGDFGHFNTAEQFDLPVTVEPGMTYPFSFTMTAPATTKVYTPVFQMTGEKGTFGTPLSHPVRVMTIDAKYVTDTIPSEMGLGDSETYTITMENLGEAPWTSLNGFALTQSDGDKFNGITEIPVGVTVNHGEQHAFSITMTPTEVGDFKPVYGMRWAGGPIGTTTEHPIKVYNGLDADYVSINNSEYPAAITMTMGTSRNVNVKMKNTGFTTWKTSNGISLAALEQGASFGPTTISYTGTDTPMNGDHTFTQTLNAPLTPGIYTIKYQMMKNPSVPGFGDVSQPLQVTVVTPTPTPVPVANFTASPESGIAPLQVTFTDKSTGPPTSWAWDFNSDGITDSTQQNPVHTYNVPGTYSVTLTATNGGGTSSCQRSIFVSLAQPIASFTVTPQTGNTPLKVSFQDTSTGGTPTKWEWDFGDGTTYVGQTPPDHEYLATGTNNQNYVVKLTVSNDAGYSYAQKTITVKIPAPDASFTAVPQSGSTPLSVTFTDTSTGSPTKWTWTFGDDSTSNERYPPIHTYTTVKSYTVTLYVENEGGSDSATKTITVLAATPTAIPSPVAPVASFTANPEAGPTQLGVTFTDTSSGPPTSWKWEFDDGTANSYSRYPSKHWYPALTGSNNKTYTVKLTVSNSLGSSSATKTITVMPKVPVANFDYTPTSGASPLQVSFTDKSTSGGTPYSWAWDFNNDGTVDSTEKNPKYTYTTSATTTYTVKLTVANDGGSHSTTKTVTVYAPPTAVFTATPKAVTTGSSVAFTDQSTNKPTSWTWNFDDGTQYTATSYNSRNPSNHLFPAVTGSTSKPYAVTLTVSNPAGSHSSQQTITVKPNKPTASFTANPTSGNTPLNVAFTDTSSIGVPYAWAWDFNNDGTIDSTEQNPTYTFTTATTVKKYTVKLTVTNDGGSSYCTQTITVNPTAPTSSFTANPMSGAVSLPVRFTDKSTGTPTKWEWDYDGNGIIDLSRTSSSNPSYTYTTAGTYNAKLTVSNPGGSHSSIQTINVYSAPVASFTASPQSGITPVSVTLTDSSTGSPTKWDWKFGDGTANYTSTNAATKNPPAHDYSTGTTQKTYTVMLTVSNTYGSSTTSKTITVNPKPPVADFIADQLYGIKPLTVSFTDKSSNSPSLWAWDFGDGTGSTSQNPSHQYTSAGKYTVTLTATNPGGSDAEVKADYIEVVSPPDAQYVGSNIPGTMANNTVYTDRYVTFKNTGGVPWSQATGFYLSCGEQAGVFGLTDQQIPSGETIQPGGECTFRFPMTSPNVNGQNFYVTFQMVKPSGVFGESNRTKIGVASGIIAQRSDDGGKSYASNDVYTFQILGPGDVPLGSDMLAFKNYTFEGGDYSWYYYYPDLNGLPNGTYDQNADYGGDIQNPVSGAPGAGQYKINVKRAITGSVLKYNDYELWVYDDMKLGQSVDHDSATKTAAKVFINEYTLDKDRIGLVTFSDSASLDYPLKYMTSNGNQTDLTDSINVINSGGETNTGEGLRLAIDELIDENDQRPVGEEGRRYIIFLTDGYAKVEGQSYASLRAQAIQQAVRAKEYNITIYTIGVGNSNTTADVDIPMLIDIADNSYSVDTGEKVIQGKYYYAKVRDDILWAFDEIGKEIDEEVTTSDSNVNLGMDRYNINGTMTTNMTLVRNSSWTMSDNNLSTKRYTDADDAVPREPAISLNLTTMPTTSVLRWNVSTIKLGGKWELHYQLNATQRGYTYPMSLNGTMGSFQVYNATNKMDIPFHSDYVYVYDNLSENVTDPLCLNVAILRPSNDTPVNEGWVTLLWRVTYDNPMSSYSQVIEYAPAGSEAYTTIASGTQFESNDPTHDFVYPWDMGSLKLAPGTSYKIRITATDPLFVSQAVVFVRLESNPGDIILTSNSSSITG